jgi:hypothetical protein
VTDKLRNNVTVL